MPGPTVSNIDNSADASSENRLLSSRARLLSSQTRQLSSRAKSRDLLLSRKSEGPNSISWLLSPVFSFFRLFLGLLREIGDENAYHRHLAIHGLQHSGTEWRRFCDERWLAASKRAKCC
jgi:hypothetical protein